MKKQLPKLITSVLLLGTVTTNTNAQVTMANNVPPFGTKYTLYTVSGSVAAASSGANQTWDYSTLPVGTAAITFQIMDPKKVSATLTDSVPTATFGSEQLGAPDPTLDAYDFTESKTTCWVKVGKKNSGHSMVTKTNDTTVVFNQTYSSTLFYNHNKVKYDGYGTLKIGTKTYTDVVKLLSYAPGSTDTLTAFYQFTPYVQMLMEFAKTNGTISGAYYFKTEAPASGIAEKANTSAAAIYPNPNNGSFSLSLPENTTNAIVQIINTLGEVLYSKTIADINSIIDMSTAAKGLYMIKIITGNQISTSKFIKQ